MRVEVLDKDVNEGGMAVMQVRIPAFEVGCALEECLGYLKQVSGLGVDADMEKLEERFGDEGLRDVIASWMVEQATLPAMGALALPVACAPHVELAAPYEADGPIAFSMTVCLQPTGTLSSAEPVTIDAATLDDVQGRSQAVMDAAVDAALVDRLELELPEAIVTFVRQSRADEFERELAERGVSLDAYLSSRKVSRKEFESRMEYEALMRLRTSVALDALFEARHMNLTAKDIDDVVGALMPGDISEGRRSLILSGAMPLVEEQARREKAHRWLVETAIVE